ncbi:hypothetical protein DFH06DRAFT_1441666 [Mycena polygramma]|nr:hypothetical protein DFH06DRAFT_1441666 [Mycena polygramma]
MRSLICIEHDDWDGTVEKIKLLGGKAGCDWVRDKERSHFAFAGMCWAKSFIPKLVWQAGERTSNLIESVHADINREGMHCTLLGGVLKVFEESGIRPSYSTGHPTENAVKNLKRKFSAYRKGLEVEDSKIWDANVKIQEMYEHLSQARSGVNTAAAALLNCHPAGHPRRYTSLIKALEVAETRFQKEKNAYRKEVEVGKLLAGSGSGQYRSGKFETCYCIIPRKRCSVFAEESWYLGVENRDWLSRSVKSRQKLPRKGCRPCPCSRFYGTRARSVKDFFDSTTARSRYGFSCPRAVKNGRHGRGTGQFYSASGRLNYTDFRSLQNVGLQTGMCVRFVRIPASDKFSRTNIEQLTPEISRASMTYFDAILDNPIDRETTFKTPYGLWSEIAEKVVKEATKCLMQTIFRAQSQNLACLMHSTTRNSGLDLVLLNTPDKSVSTSWKLDDHLDLPKSFFRSVEAYLSATQTHEVTAKGAPAFKPATKGRVGSPAVRPEKIVLNPQYLAKGWSWGATEAFLSPQQWSKFILQGEQTEDINLVPKAVNMWHRSNGISRQIALLHTFPVLRVKCNKGVQFLELASWQVRLTLAKAR